MKRAAATLVAFAVLALTVAANRKQQGIVVWLSPLPGDTLIEATMTRGLVINAPTNLPVYLRLKGGTVWREAKAPVTVQPGQHVRVVVPRSKAP